MDRPGLIFIPGMMCDARLFAPQIEALAACFAMEVADIGGACDMAQLARCVLAKTRFERFAVCGLSMGGIVAMAMLQEAPERISRLALLDTNHHADARERYALRNRQIDDVRAGHLHRVIVDEMKPNYLARANRGNHALLTLLVDMAMDLGPAVFVNQSLALRDRPDYTSALSAYPGRALVMCGAEDQLCPPERHHEIAALMPSASLEIVAGAGHISTLEQPDTVTRLLSDFLMNPASEAGHA